MTVLNFPATPAINATYTENGVTYTWNGSYWDANSGTPLDDKYVEIAGDVMTGNLLLPGGGGSTAALQKQEIDALITTGTLPYVKKSGDVMTGDLNLPNLIFKPLKSFKRAFVNNNIVT